MLARFTRVSRLLATIVLGALLWLGSTPAKAQDFSLIGVTLDAQGRTQVRYLAQPQFYYVLERGPSLNAITVPVDMALGAPTTGELRDPSGAAGAPASFYRVRAWARSDPRDQDQDGMDDLFELERSSFLDPLNPADAAVDFDGDGRSNLEEYRGGSDPALADGLTRLTLSPADGEFGVSVQREVIARFSAPLAPGTTLTPIQFKAEFGGRNFLTRVEVAPDRRLAWLFFLEPLPAAARIRVTLDASQLQDEQGRRVDADGDGLPGGQAVVEYETASATMVPRTAVIGRVFASEVVGTGSINRPLPGVTITVDGQEQTLRAVTDSAGFFHLDPAPAGEFFVHVDGRTSPESTWPGGAYYPFVGKKWSARAGQTNNLANETGEIFLPLIPADALQEVSALQETVITFPPSVLQQTPSLAGVALTVPPNALFNDAGVRGGRVGLAPVPPDRLPEPLPEGLRFPLVITVQTDGPQNFDQPVPVRFPNLPDPLTGEVLPPGSSTGLWSFNHDTGRWELQGPATVSADGRFVDSDAGVGIRQPGWHGVFQAVVATRTRAGRRPPPLPWPSIAALLDGDYAAKAGSAAAPLALQISCIASNSCLAQATWGAGFVQRTFSDTALNTVNGVERLPSLPFPGTETLCNHLPGWLPIVGSALTVKEVCSVLNGFGHHFLYDLLPSFAKYCTLLNPSQHDNFFTNAVVPCFNNTVAAGQMAPWAGAAAQQVVPPSAGALRDVMTALCPLLKFVGIAGNRPRPAAELPFPELPPALTREQLFSEDIAAISQLRIDTGGRFFLNVGDTLQLRVFRTVGGVEQEITAEVQGTFYLAAVSDETVSVSADGWLEVHGTLSPVTTLTPLVYVVVQNGNEFGIAQFAIRDTDQDGDRIVDSLEVRFGLDPQVWNGPESDLDGDGLPDFMEVLLRTKPRLADTDGDGLADGVEVAADLDPLSPSADALLREGGQHYFAVENLANGAVVRGIAGEGGMIPEGLILAPETRYRIWFLQAATGELGWSEFTTPRSGRTVNVPPVALLPDSTPDLDGDGLGSGAEFVLGSSATQPDSDGDGIPDGAELLQGTNPLDGLLVQPGIIASVVTGGTAVDVAAENDRAVVALEEEGVAVVSVFSGQNPVVTSRIKTTRALRVALAGNQVAVADGPGGLVVLALASDASASLRYRLSLESAVQCVAAAGGLAVAGTVRGDVFAVDLSSGLILSRLDVGNTVKDLWIQGDLVYALTDTTVEVLELFAGTLSQVGSVQSPTYSQAHQRLFVGGGLLYAVQGKGVNTFDLAQPTSPRLIQSENTTQFGWKQLVATGANLGLAAVGPNSTFDGRHELSLFDLSVPTANPQFITQLETPGVARAVTLYNGLAYVADGAAGLQVINFLSYDRGGVAPTITLNLGSAAGRAEEGQYLRVTAVASDDVQVRQVQFYLDGVRVLTDGNFPFEARLLTPLRSSGQTTVKLRARAIDTGGNQTWSDEQVLTLVPDATPPRVLRTIPFSGALLGAVDSAALFLSEPLDPLTVSPANLTLTSSGADQLLGTSDDEVIPLNLESRETLKAVFLSFAKLPPGQYRLTAGVGLRDRSGNPLPASTTSDFRVFSFIDVDQDGVPDELEPSLGLDPTRVDSDGDGLNDGWEDPDRDDLVTAWEVLSETDPTRADTDGDGVRDGAEDPDGDGLSHTQESLAGTHPLDPDTDRDGWNDETEVTGSSDPLNPASRPRLMIRGTPSVAALRTGLEAGALFTTGVFLGTPSVSVGRPGFDSGSTLSSGTYLGRPPTMVNRLGWDPAERSRPGAVIGRPPVSVGRTGFPTDASSGSIHLALPPVNVVTP